MVDYLGLVLSEGHVEMDPIKIASAWDWLTPKNVTEVQSFVGFVNFYHRVHPQLLACSWPPPLLDQEGGAMAMDRT